MFLNKHAKVLHVVRFRKGPVIYMTTTDDPETSALVINEELRCKIFNNKEFQLAYELAKTEMGLLDPDPNDVIFHQFITNDGSSGYLTGHWLIRDYLARNTGLDVIANIGDWLDAEGFIDITPPDQDKHKFLRVTDIGKYYAAEGYFEVGVYPLYILAEENNQIQASGLLENHRDEQPKRGGYDRAIVYGGNPSPVLLDYNDVSIDLTADEEQVINNKPISANGRLYSNINQFAHARNLPTWFVLQQINVTSEKRYNYSQDWHFV
ncbi:hypothetical protein pEaSNUABM37_00321 [Erwinia phage pEa_SNUABM_37]|nr:hypothetical protein pEaSNUABM37_00321 [Erwinia phage pEa_SNUABM_37]QXO10789.1 hypothetical protein pEaSNUABM48_00321 [Erwinia phage pEa_SNUABM_48]